MHKNQPRLIINNTKLAHITEPTPKVRLLRKAVINSKYQQYNPKPMESGSILA